MGGHRVYQEDFVICVYIVELAFLTHVYYMYDRCTLGWSAVANVH